MLYDSRDFPWRSSPDRRQDDSIFRCGPVRMPADGGDSQHEDEQKSRQALIEEIHSLRTLIAGNGMQEALQAIEERYRAMIEGIGDGYNEVDPAAILLSSTSRSGG
jgi:hypothetical protein